MNEKDIQNLGYACPRKINDKWCALRRMIYTVGVFIDLDETSARGGRICFDTYENAFQFLLHWDGETDPVVGDDGCTADKRTRIEVKTN